MGTKAKTARKQLQASPEELLEILQRFLDGCQEPVLVEAGEKPIPLHPGRYVLETQRDGCLLHAWGEDGNVARRIIGIERQSPHGMDVRARSFGRGDLRLSLADRARAGGRLDREASHVRFREYLRRLLTREFADWKISNLSSAPDLEHSLSPLYARAVLSQGQEAWAVLGASAELDAAVCDRILAFGLIWFDLLRPREDRRVFRGLKLFLPKGRTRTTANRLAFLNRAAFRFELYQFDRHGNVTRIDERDYGNLATDLRPCLPVPVPAEPVAGWLEQLRAIPGVEETPRADGVLALRVRGIEFARAGKGVLACGLDELRPVVPERLQEVLTLARELARFRSSGAADPQNPLYRRHPESWLESQVRQNLGVLDSTLLPEPVYSQVPAVAGPDRGMIDLLASDDTGRLAVLELKAGEDPHLPLQALDYWMRVRWHLDRGELRAKGYFRGIELSSLPPRLLLVSPAFDFHPTTETILRYFSPEIPVERIGVSAEWREQLKVVFRKAGAQRLA